MLDKIILKGMQFYAYHGVLSQERELGQRFEVDVELFLDLKEAGQRDDLNFTVDYEKVFQLVKEQVTAYQRNLLETVAENIASVILRKFSIKEIIVRLKKPYVPLPGQIEYAAVEIRRKL